MSRITIVALASTLVHFIWQGAAIALIAGFATAALSRARPTTRYAVLCAALAAMLLVPAATFFVLRLPPAAVPSLTSAVASSIVPAAASAGSSRAQSAVEPFWFLWLVRIWLAGVVLLGLRSIAGWGFAQRLRRFKTQPAADSVVRAASELCERLGIRRAVRIVNTAATDVPATLGWLRPVVLLPISALTALTPEQIELLIAHELAHVRRHDYLVNLVQTAVETVLFYHPAVWWVSGRIRAEREHCCDDLAVGACGNVDQYVRALAALEGSRGRPRALVLAADGGSLLSRIQRLLNRQAAQRFAPPAWLGAFVPAALVLAAVFSVTPPEAIAQASPKPKGEPSGFLGELTAAGYPKLTVDEIIALKDHGVAPRYVKAMLAAGLGVPSVEQLITLRDHGVSPDFTASMAMSGLVSDLDFERVIKLRENDVRGDDLLRIRALGFGPFTAGDVVKLRQHGVEASTFEALKEAGAHRAGVDDAIVFRENDVTTDRIRDMKRQGFDNMSLEQILKLRRSGII
jgi:beta-lactamase regulating signal transducer with metallopeptidase domain